MRLPFQLRLDAFRVEQGDPEYRLYAYVQPDGRGGFERGSKSYRPARGWRAGRSRRTCASRWSALAQRVDRGHRGGPRRAGGSRRGASTGWPDPPQGPFARRDSGWRRMSPRGALPWPTGSASSLPNSP